MHMLLSRVQILGHHVVNSSQFLSFLQSTDLLIENLEDAKEVCPKLIQYREKNLVWAFCFHTSFSGLHLQSFVSAAIV